MKKALVKISYLLAQIPKAFCWCFAVYIIFIIGLCAFATRVIGPSKYAYFTLYNYLFFSIAALVIFLFFIIALVIKKKNIKYPKVTDKAFIWFTILVCVAMTGYYVFLINHMVYFPSGDSLNVTLSRFEIVDIAKVMQNPESGHLNYFSTYPNLQFQLGLFYHFKNFMVETGLAGFILNLMQVGVTPDNIAWLLLCIAQIIGCLLVQASCVFASLIVRKYFGNIAGIVTLLLSSYFVGFSPLTICPYSDNYAMFFVTLTIWSYICLKNSNVKIFIILFFPIVGFAIKPTAIATLLAILIVEICKCLKKLSIHSDKQFFTIVKSKTKSWLSVLGVSIVSVVLACMCVVCVSNIGVNYNNDKSFDMFHYLAMGFNEDYDGAYVADDVEESSAIENPQERRSYNINKIIDRITDLGPSGVLKLWTVKSMQNFCNGTQTPWYVYYLYQPTEEINDYVKDFYGVTQKIGDKSLGSKVDCLTPFNISSEIIWFIVLIGCVAGAIIYRKDNKLQALIISLLMISVFLMLFESASRYLFLYKSLFVSLGCLGLISLIKILSDKIIVNNTSNNE